LFGLQARESARDLLPPDALAARPDRDDAVKVTIFQYVTVTVFLFLLTGFWDLQVRNHGFYKERAEANEIKSVPILAPRGKILDRDGRVIVDNDQVFSLSISREILKDEHIRPIAEGLNLDGQDLENRLRRFRQPKYKPMTVKEDLSEEDLAFVRSHGDAATFPELNVITAHRRYYPASGFLSHLLGYVGEVSESELNSDMAKYNQGDKVGKAGIEKYYNEHLMGVDGKRRVIVDNLGVVRRETEKVDAISGKNLLLTVDLDLQAVAELALEGRVGAVVAMDPRSGEVLAMASRPTYDANKFALRLRASDWKEITENPDNPLLNRAIQAQLAPGSTFKPLVALAGIESGLITDSYRVTCGGGASFYGHYHKCHARRGHGVVDLRRAISQSCDVFFYTVGNAIGVDKLYEYAGTMAGLGKRTGIDLPHESEGIMPSSKWKIRTLRQKWFKGDMISVAIGQGYVAISPLQLAVAMGGLVNGGVWHKPHVAKLGADPASARRFKIDPASIQRIVEGLYGVVNVDGTAPQARIPGLTVAGKTGTAQRISNEALKGKKAEGKLRDDAWFFGFAPRENPEILVVALFENAEHGNAAAPIVRDVIKAHFDKKARRQMLAQGSPAERLSRLLVPTSGASE
jgi:penicillin-binding protein 2